MKYLLFACCLFLLSCKTNQKYSPHSGQVVFNACEMDKISDLKNAVIFFGIADEDSSEKVLGILKGDSFRQTMKEKNLKLVVVDELCLFGEALINEHKVMGFPTILKIDEDGKAVEISTDEATESGLKGRFLNKF